MTTCNLSDKTCAPCAGIVPKLISEEVKRYLMQVKEWKSNEDSTEIFKEFKFKNYHEVMAFVNAVAFIAHRENHHPDLEVSYNKVKIRYSTHAISGLSENDFICAAKVDGLGV